MFFFLFLSPTFFFFFFFNDTATTEIYTLSLHDALPICDGHLHIQQPRARQHGARAVHALGHMADRKSTRLNSSHTVISYAVFCLKKKKKKTKKRRRHRSQKRRYTKSLNPYLTEVGVGRR